MMMMISLGWLKCVSVKKLPLRLHVAERSRHLRLRSLLVNEGTGRVDRDLLRTAS